jgi:glycosyltransferase involved in cell wall biosynthesis
VDGGRYTDMNNGTRAEGVKSRIAERTPADALHGNGRSERAGRREVAVPRDWEVARNVVEGSDRSREVRVSVIVPALDEARNLPYVLPRIPTSVHEVVLVDGGSLDGTVEVARVLWPGVRVVGQERPGKGAALQAGFRAATGDIIVTIDADGSTDPAEIPLFVQCLLAGADFVKGSRFVQGGGTDDMGIVRRSGNWMLRTTVRVAFGGRYSDLCYGYNAFWRSVLPVIDGDADGFEIETLMNVRVLAAGMRVAEVPSHEGRRIYGLSHLSTFRDGYRVLRTIARERLQLSRRGRPAQPPQSQLEVSHAFG